MSDDRVMRWHVNRADLGSALIEEYGSQYAAILADMAGRLYRSESLSQARQKTMRAQAEGMRVALCHVLRLHSGLSEKEARQVIKRDEARWREAIEKDESVRRACEQEW